MATGCKNSVSSIAEAETLHSPIAVKHIPATSTSRAMLRLYCFCAIGNTSYPSMETVSICCFKKSVANAVAAPQDEPCNVAVPRNAVGNCCGGWGKHALYLSPFCHHFNQTNVHYYPFPANCQEEKFEKSEKKRGFWALFIKIVELYKIYQITFQERLTVVTNLQEMIGQKKNDFRSRLLGMSRRQIKVF